jgi:16S rRNA (guanine(527)-N(7))-methyltransferase RsmG
LAVFADLLHERLAGICRLSPAQVAILDSHYQLLLRWNRVLNLTSINQTAEAVERHYCESLFLAAQLPNEAIRIADVGSGAGFPGFPVAVFCPAASVTLIESHQRKAVFLREASRSVPNIRVVSQRAEGLAEEFDLVISRAVSYEDLASFLKKLAPKADLLTGGEAPPEGIGFVWEPPIPLPWGRQRFLSAGRRP